MLVSIRDCKRSAKDRQWIERIYGEYLDDLSQLNTGVFPVVVDYAARDGEIFANWFANDLSHPLVIVRGTESVGFALVTRPRTTAADQTMPRFLISEFFIRNAHRRISIGRDAATLIFNRFAGNWEIVEYERNPVAIAFWRRVLTVYTSGRFEERSQNGEVRQRFQSNLIIKGSPGKGK